MLYVDETVKRHRLRLHQKTRPLVTEICEATKSEDEKDAEKLYQKILAVITLLSGLGSPVVPSILRYLWVLLRYQFNNTVESYINSNDLSTKCGQSRWCLHFYLKLLFFHLWNNLSYFNHHTIASMNRRRNCSDMSM